MDQEAPGADSSQGAEPLLRWSVPGLNRSTPTELAVGPGAALVIVGPNGAGKSALSHWLSTNRGGSSTPVTRILAHRRLWLQSAGAEVTASQRASMETNFTAWDREITSRVRLNGDSERPSKILYDLMAKVNGRNARIAELVDTQQDPHFVEESLLTTISRVFAAAHLDIDFRITDAGTFDAVRPSGEQYAISEMSDGEKGAFLLAAETLLAPRDSVLILDEPERHLHRAISSDLTLALIEERSDCGFVLLTHDLALVDRLEPPSAKVFTVTEISWDQATPSGWALRADAQTGPLPDSARQAILGGRNQLLFVEGRSSSLDFPLYRLLFPEWTVVPCGGSDEVSRVTTGLTEAAPYHWVEGQGVLDGDARSYEEVAALAEKKIKVLPVNEVENLYYLPFIVDAIADQQAAVLGEDPSAKRASARNAAIKSLVTNSVQHLAAVNAEKILRRQALARLPSRRQLVTADATLTVDLISPYPSEESCLSDLVTRADYDSIVRRYSIRDSGFLKAVANELGFQDRNQYERAVRVRLANDGQLLGELRKVVGPLPVANPPAVGS